MYRIEEMGLCEFLFTDSEPLDNDSNVLERAAAGLQRFINHMKIPVMPPAGGALSHDRPAGSHATDSAIKAETFREFFARRNNMPFPAIPGGVEPTARVMKRLAETMADWCDELAARQAERPSVTETSSHLEHS